MEKGLNIVMQDLIGRLYGRYHAELSGHYSILFGRRNVEGEPYAFEVAAAGQTQSLDSLCVRTSAQGGTDPNPS